MMSDYESDLSESEIAEDSEIYTVEDLAELVGLQILKPVNLLASNSTPPENFIEETFDVTSINTNCDPPEITANKENESPRRKRRRKPQPHLWQRNQQYAKRESGEEYLGISHNGNLRIKQIRLRRSMGIRCKSHGRIKINKCCSFSDKDREEIFNQFWHNLTWPEKKIYICALVVGVPTKDKGIGIGRKTSSFKYHLQLQHGQRQQQLRVCKKMFLNTFGLREWQVRHWKQNESTKKNKKTEEGSLNSAPVRKRSQLSPEIHEHLTNFLEELPKLPSHYCRKETEKEYLEPIFSKTADVFRCYREACKASDIVGVGRTLFLEKFKEMNLSVYHPKKDQCDTCVSFRQGNLDQAVYDLHITRKELARAEKDHDKGLGLAEKCHVFTMDLQSVKLAPSLQASSMYYKTKLCCHNFTIYDLATRYTANYFWNESEGELVASTFASCVYSLLKTKYCGTKLPIVLYSDGCTYQNRNQILSNALSRLAVEFGIEIFQKFLEKGHTQMECDSVHSTIERRLKGREIYLPTDYIGLIREARKEPEPYDVFYLNHDFFLDFSDKRTMLYESIRPGNMSGEPVVTDIRVLKYSPNGKIFYKLTFSQEFEELPRVSKPKALQKTISKLYQHAISISARKYKDLQDLKHVIPQHCHDFYDKLPRK